MYFEDVDLSWRLRRKGLRLRYQPSSVIRHTHAGTSTEGSPLFVFFTARNRLLMLLKNAPWSNLRSAFWEESRHTTNLFLAWLRAPKSGGARAAAFESFWLRARVLASALVHAPGALLRRLGA
jgi:GT2 family glycosyltransferase